MERRLREVIADRRRERFVGRSAELALFSAALTGRDPDLAVLHVHGMGGVGKSALLRRFAEQARGAGRVVVRVDGHDVQPNPASFTAATGAVDGRSLVVLVDSYELLEPLDSWLREEFIAGLAASSLVVLSGRQPPTAGWRTDPGWRGMLRVLQLGSLSMGEAVGYLAAAGAPVEVREPVATATGGHPLALGLVTDVFAQRGPTDLTEAVLGDPDVLATLVARLLDGAPDLLHRTALAACAVARFTTEASLRAALEIENAHEPFAWLRGLSCVEAGPRGLYPHDVARDVLAADLRWRDESLYWLLWRRIRADIAARIRREEGSARRDAIFDLVFTTRTNPASRRYWRWETFGAATPERVQPVDRAAVMAIVAAHEGSASAQVAERWLDRQPGAFTVYRSRGEVAGLAAWLTVTDADSDDVIADPVTAAALRHAADNGLAAGEEVVVRRFLIDRDVYQDPSPAVDLSLVTHFELVASRPQLAWTFMAVDDPDYWTPQLTADLGFHRVPGPHPPVGGRGAALFARDSRVPNAVFDPVRASPERGSVAMSRAEFAQAVRAALRNVGRVEVLSGSPLLNLRAVRERGGDPPALRAVLVEATDLLQAHPRDAKLFRVLDRTYLRPAPTQERAAELLGLPATTYRRHLTGGIARIVDVLWQQERGSG